MRGVVPACLIESYDFWQNADNTITGDPKTGAFVPKSSKIKITLRPSGEPDNKGYGNSLAGAVIQRHQIAHTGKKCRANGVPDAAQPHVYISNKPLRAISNLARGSIISATCLFGRTVM